MVQAKESQVHLHRCNLDDDCLLMLAWFAAATLADVQNGGTMLDQR